MDKKNKKTFRFIEKLSGSNYFIATEQHPHQLSVGAVVLNDKGEVLCHHFRKLQIEGEGECEVYLLIRETPEPNEPIEAAVHRGLREEAGVTADIQAYIGSIVSHFPRGKRQAEKTTLYFLCTLKGFDPAARKPTDEESESELEFMPINELVERMKRQRSQFTRTDLDESSILEVIK